MKKDEIPENEGAKARVQKVIQEMTVQKNDWRKPYFFIKLIIVYIDVLFKLYLAMICSGSINAF